jgi:hypothetical protein
MVLEAVRGGDDVVPMAEEEQGGTVPECGSEVQVDDVIPRCGDSVEAVGVRQRGLNGVEEGTGNFGSLTASKSKSSS